MIDLYTYATFNGQRVSIMLEETGLAYTAHKIDLLNNEQHSATFVKLNPTARIPVIVDHLPGENEPFVLSQSIAILQYLADKTGTLMPNSKLERARVAEWVNFQAIDLGSNLFSAFYLQTRCCPAQDQAAELLRERVIALYQHFDDQLSRTEYIAGDQYSIADVVTLPAVISQQEVLKQYSHLMRWMEQLNKREAVQRGMAVPE